MRDEKKWIKHILFSASVLAGIATILGSATPPKPSTSIPATTQTTSTNTLQTTEYNANYVITLVKVEKPGSASKRYGAPRIEKLDATKYNFSYQDEILKISWLASNKTLGFVLENKTSNSLKIIWDEAVFIDENNKSHRVMHSGIKYSEREKPQAPSIVARGSSIEDIVFPTSYVTYSEGHYSKYSSIAPSWNEKPFFPAFYYHSKYSTGSAKSFDQFTSDVRSNIGKKIQVNLPIQIRDITNDYTFIFEVSDVKTSVGK